MAYVNHLQWGPSIDFTYGPLRFLVDPTLYYRSTSLLAIVFLVVENALLVSWMLVLLRGVVPTALAVVLAYVVDATAVNDGAPDLLLLALGFLAVVSIGHLTPRRQWIACACLGAAGAVGGLVLLTVALATPIFLVIAAVTSANRLKCLGAGLVAFALVYLGLWSFVGGSLTNLASYWRYSRQIVGGYSAAMSLGPGPLGAKLLAAGCIAIVLAGLFLASRSGIDRRLLAMGFAAAVFTYVMVREGFVRVDVGHESEFFALLTVIEVGILASSTRSRIPNLVGLAIVIGSSWYVAGAVPAGLATPAANVRAIATQVADDVQPAKAEAIIRNARAALVRHYGISPGIISALQGETVAIEPWENTVAWAYPSINWDPEPVLQSYSAYTTGLDQLDAKFLESSSAPERILEDRVRDIDTRDASWDPPATVLAILCNYRELGVSGNWELLGHVPDRCGRPTALGTVEVKAGTTVRVPQAAPGEIVVASFSGIGSSTIFRLAQIVFRPPPITFAVKAGGVWSKVRFLAGTQSDLHVMVTPPSLGYSPPFRPRFVTALRIEEEYSASSTCTVRFSAIRLQA